MRNGRLRMICLSVMVSTLLCRDARAVTHRLRYFLTASCGSPPLPEFTAFSTLDGVQWGYCDSSGRVEPEQEWIKKILQENPQSFEHYAHKCERNKYLYRDHIENLKRQMNQSEGVHIFQRIHGCEWDDETEDAGGFNQFGYDGEDFLSFDLETLTWVAAKPQALITKHKWDRDVLDMEVHKIFYVHRCPERLKKYLGYLKRFKKKTEDSLLSSQLPRHRLLP
ncbi:H-2 class I histocompatibility antigen, K-D alpha chain-like isoform X2 [Nelusetta ayraudi]|uniref:H-2 class I histocompatibility antigen, K-D alpha chain-like isoform X2 n=1 Tax=Nelusetta ayraudi TaxID=303726 RepID=UPI003F7024A8